MNERHPECPLLCIGIGNAYRCDDAAGLVAARVLQTRSLSGVTIIEHSGEGAALMQAWAGAEMVILMDAVSSGGEPGTLYRLDASQPVPAEFFHYSTHAFSVAEAVEMARALGELPPVLVIYGIEGQNFAQGVGLSPVVESNLTELVEQVVREIAALRT